MPVLVSLLADNKVYLLTHEKEVRDFETKEKAIAYFEKPYAKKRMQGYVGSVTAVLNAIAYQPSVHEWNDADLSRMLDMGIIEDETFHDYRMHHDTGTMTGALCTGPHARSFHESGIKPRT